VGTKDKLVLSLNELDDGEVRGEFTQH